MGFASRLDRIAADPCPPDVIGINHYLTSDRFLDHRVHRYPLSVHGGNGQQRYADVEASRVLDPPPAGIEGALREAWERYGIPVALTEVHNGCTREEQLRWVAQAWDTATQLANEGVAVRAVTIWSLLGSMDWNRLLTGPGLYEPGVYDVKSGSPRPTRLATMVSGLPNGADRHPATQGAGWWQRPIRLNHPAVRRPSPLAAYHGVRDAGATMPPLLILGATGTLGQAFARACRHRNLAHVLTARDEVRLGDGDSVARALARHQPWAVINAAGWVRVDDAEDEPDACLFANADAAIEVARLAAQAGVPTLSFSSDLVFDGALGRAYTEDDPVSPLGVYGESKARMEEGLASLAGTHLIVRTAAFFSHDDVHNFAVAAAAAARRRERFHAASDLYISPTYVPHLVAACLDLLIDGEQGLWHLTNGTAVSWAEFAQRVCGALGLPQEHIVPTCGAELGFKAKRPRSVALESRKGASMPGLDEAIAHFAGGYSHLACRERVNG
jgi:dTDP-4-dehydrorhamnose reductase